MHERTISKNRFLRTWDGPLVHFKHGKKREYDNILPTTNITIPLNSAKDAPFICHHFDVWSGFLSVDRLFAVLAFYGKKSRIPVVSRGFLEISSLPSTSFDTEWKHRIEPKVSINSITIGFYRCSWFKRFQPSKYLKILWMHENVFEFVRICCCL